MNILVVLRAVRDPDGFTVNRAAEKIFVNRESFVFNPADRNALEAGLALAAELAAAGKAAQVTAVAYGGEPAEDLLRQALAMGANRAVLVAEPALAAPDAYALTIVLKQVVVSPAIGGADLILLGAEVLDADLAQVGPRLAEALGWPFVEGARQASMQGDRTLALAVPDGAACRAGALATRAFRSVQADGSVVASVARDSNRPRFAPAAQIIRAYTAPRAVDRLSLADLDLTAADIAPLTRSRGESFPAPSKLGVVLDGADDQTVRKLLKALRQR